MSHAFRILGLIPARAGSKRLPGKNYRELCGKPLIAWTLDAAMASTGLSDVVVSTDDPHVAQIAREMSVECIARPAELATDSAASIDVMLHALDSLRSTGRTYDAVMLLQPTSPLRGAPEIQAAADLSRRYPERTIVSMCPAECPSSWMAQPDASGLICHFDPARLEPASAPLRLNGAIYVIPEGYLRETRRMYTEPTVPYVMPRNISLDIDTEEDFSLCAFVMARRLKCSCDHAGLSAP